MDVRRCIKCARCGDDFTFDDIRYLPSGKVACMKCLGIVEQEHKEMRVSEGKLFSIECIDCRYMFQRTEHNTPKRCPECGAKKLVRFDKENITSEKLLRNV